jgi:dipeptidyl aminopeptidase/acylaminoacyl peptidase
VRGDQRLLVGHERRGRDELLIWDIAAGSVTELVIDLPGDLDADFYPDGSALLVVHTHAGRTTVHRYDLVTAELTDLPVAVGVVSGAAARSDGSVWYRWSSAASPGQLRVLDATGADGLLVAPPGPPAPGSEPVRDVWVDGPGGPIHALLAVPPAESVAAGPWPTVFAVHGGPAAGDEDSFDASRAAWLDAGFAVVQVNYRGSTGYGSAWRDALTERIGHTELADIAAVHDHLAAVGTVDPAASVIAGYSWGGFLALLALGTQPERWAAGVAGVPVADYLAAYEDEMEPLRAYDRALFGGSPAEVPDAYRDSSPLTYVDRVRAPVLVLAGENDPRCPIRQIDNYLDALAVQGSRYAVYRYDAGHGSMVVAERLRQLACEIGFVRDVLGLPH